MFSKQGKKYLSVYTYGAPVLREESQRITEVTDEIRLLATEMLEALHLFDGIGLAAPQYGHPLQLVVFDVPARNNTGSVGERLLLPQMPLTVINPEIAAAGSEMVSAEEGCLSLPGVFGEVTRPATVLFRGETLDGEHLEVECGGLLARCMQHEIDHLHGVVFTDRMTNDNQRRVRGDLDLLVRKGGKTNFRRSLHR